jgi:hypothetical protein
LPRAIRSHLESLDLSDADLVSGLLILFAEPQKQTGKTPDSSPFALSLEIPPGLVDMLHNTLRLEINAMKTSLFVLCLFCATAALGQALGGSTLSSQPQVFQVPSHPEHASRQPMAQQRDLLEESGSAYARGERALWEVAPVPHTMLPLGDAARTLRKEHTTAKKADVVWEN